MDAQIISALSGGALLVVRKDKTQLNNLQLLKEALQDTGSQCLGAVLNDF
jgi:Mrp family chromosome partitioning ATPase